MKTPTKPTGIQTFEALEAFKHFDQLDWPENIRVFSGNLDDNLQVLADVDFQHLLQAGHGLFSGEIAEVINKPL